MTPALLLALGLACLSRPAPVDQAPEGAGPFLTRASLNYTLHRAEADLLRAEGAVIVSDNTVGAITGMRANLLLQRGQAAAAEAVHRDALSLHRTPTGVSALAMALARWDEAEALLDEAAGSYHGRSVESLAWFLLHKGIFELSRDRLDEALVHYQDALAIMPGWWLAEEHVAEIAVLQGRDDQALALDTDIVARTGLPEFMDAIAGVLSGQGQGAEAQRWRQRARQVYEGQLALFPEAAAGHALQHFLDAGDSPDRALALAQENVDIRPNAEALGLLADAFDGAGRGADAARTRRRAEQVD